MGLRWTVRLAVLGVVVLCAAIWAGSYFCTFRGVWFNVGVERSVSVYNGSVNYIYRNWHCRATTHGWNAQPIALLPWRQWPATLYAFTFSHRGPDDWNCNLPLWPLTVLAGAAAFLVWRKTRMRTWKSAFPIETHTPVPQTPYPRP